MNIKCNIAVCKGGCPQKACGGINYGGVGPPPTIPDESLKLFKRLTTSAVTEVPYGPYSSASTTTTPLNDEPYAPPRRSTILLPPPTARRTTHTTTTTTTTHKRIVPGVSTALFCTASLVYLSEWRVGHSKGHPVRPDKFSIMLVQPHIRNALVIMI